MVATRPPFWFVGFGTDRLRCEEAMKTAGRENPNCWATLASNRAPGAGGQNRSCSIQWAEKQENVQPALKCFFLTSPFIELSRNLLISPFKSRNRPGQVPGTSDASKTQSGLIRSYEGTPFLKVDSQDDDRNGNVHVIDTHSLKIIHFSLAKKG